MGTAGRFDNAYTIIQQYYSTTPYSMQYVLDVYVHVLCTKQNLFSSKYCISTSTYMHTYYCSTVHRSTVSYTVPRSLVDAVSISRYTVSIQYTLYSTLLHTVQHPLSTHIAPSSFPCQSVYLYHVVFIAKSIVFNLHARPQIVYFRNCILSALAPVSTVTILQFRV